MDAFGQLLMIEKEVEAEKRLGLFHMSSLIQSLI